jgi:transketolase
VDIVSPNKAKSVSEILAMEMRESILRMTHSAQASHVGSALSVTDILAVLYSGVASVSASGLSERSRDVVILSKGHACAALYSVLGLCGFFPQDWLTRYCNDGAELNGHVTSANCPGVELSTGSLGHGLPYGLGIQLARKLSLINGRCYVVMSDGECDEGTTWESALIANHHDLNSLTVVIDRNRLQSMGSTEETLSLEPLASKWESFGWNVRSIDGHNHEELRFAFLDRAARGPTCIIANTVKGKGVEFMENQVLWHYRPPNMQELTLGLSLLQGKDL